MTANGEPGANSDESSLNTLPLPDIRTSPMPNGTGSHKSSTVIESQPKRRVSIIADAPMIGGASGGAAGYDNLAYEQNPRRKISQVSSPQAIESIVVDSVEWVEWTGVNSL